jgi:prepilin-type N-terminal cleavage/methylation domain-containing protein
MKGKGMELFFRGASFRAGRGMTLIELMIAMALLAVIFTGLGVTVLRADRNNVYNNDRAIAHKAAQEVLEVIHNESIDDTVARDGTTFDVLGLSTDGTNAGTITVSDLGWDSSSAQAYLVTINVGTAQEIFARVHSVRTR